MVNLIELTKVSYLMAGASLSLVNLNFSRTTGGLATIFGLSYISANILFLGL